MTAEKVNPPSRPRRPPRHHYSGAVLPRSGERPYTRFILEAALAFAAGAPTVSGSEGVPCASSSSSSSLP